MKIINKTPSPKVAKQTICTNCGVTLEYVPADTCIEKHTDYTGSSDMYRKLICINCNEKLNVPLY